MGAAADEEDMPGLCCDPSNKRPSHAHVSPQHAETTSNATASDLFSMDSYVGDSDIT